jgi:autophagy-related protein 9
MRQFYTHLLKVPDVDISTISWSTVVSRIEAIRDENPITAVGNIPDASTDNNVPTAKLDVHDVANRIMRQENYLIALFNKNLLDLRLPIPTFIRKPLTLIGLYAEIDDASAKNKTEGTTLTRALEWNLRFCLMNYLFDDSGRVKEAFLKERNRDALIKGSEIFHFSSKHG